MNNINAQANKTYGFYSPHEYFLKGSGMATLCGSTRFEAQAFKCHKDLTLVGWTVLMCGFWVHGMHKGEIFTAEQMLQVKQLHFHKLLESDVAIIVTDHTGYTGESTQEEWAFCKARNIPVFTFDGEQFGGFNWCNLPQRYADNSLIEGFRRDYAARNAG